MLSQKLQDQYYSRGPTSRGITEVVPNHWLHTTVTERELVQDSLTFLESGVSNFFKEDPVSHDFRLSRAIEVKHLSSESLKKQLESIAHFYSSHSKIDIGLVQYDELEGSVIQRLMKVINQVQTKVKLELSYLQIIFGIQNGK
jgi:hypothetical protein